jgi:hypothetical protein
LAVLSASPSRIECDKVQRLLDRYRDLLATAKDEMLRRGIMSQIDSLEQRLRDCSEDADPPALPRSAVARPRSRMRSRSY